MHENLEYKCEFCDERFASGLDLTAHKTHHANKIKYKCDKCDCDFFTLSNLQIHLENHIVPIVTCGKCGKSCKGDVELKRHLATHTQWKKYVCDVCSAVFYSSRSLERHVWHHEYTT